MADPNESMQPLTEQDEESLKEAAKPPAWANTDRSLGASMDSSGKPSRPLLRAKAVTVDDDDDVFDGKAQTPPESRKGKKKVRISGLPSASSFDSSPSPRSPMLLPSWANASFDLDPHRPSGQRPEFKRQQSLPASPTYSPRRSRMLRQQTAPASPTERPFKCPPPRRSKRLSSQRSIDVGWANTSVGLGEPEPPEVPEFAFREPLLPEVIDEKPVPVEEEKEPEEEERAGWGGKMEFIFTCIGYAVGLGNVWRFPYLAYKNGGGAFLIPYVFMLALVGLPLFFMELCMGQFTSLGPISYWKINPLLKGMGYAMVATSWMIGIYYNVIISHVLLFLFASLASIPNNLPWVSCDNPWNTPDCITPVYDDGVALGNGTDAGNASYVIDTVTKAAVAAVASAVNATDPTPLLNGTGVARTPAEEYYNNFVLEQSTGFDDMGTVNWKLALCLLLAWVIVLVSLIKGIQSLGKVVYFTALFPYVMLTILLIRGLTLKGAWVGIKFYLNPDWARLADSRVWCDAATQIFYSLGACTGGLIAMSSYSKFDNNCLKDSLIVAVINCATSIYAGFVIFSVLGFMAVEKGVPVGEVATGGPGLAFIVYPEAIARMPVPVLWAIGFFVMMATLGFGSQFSMVEAVLSAFTDEFQRYIHGRWRSIIFRSIMIFIMFLLGLPMVTKGGIYLLNLVDYAVSGFPLLVIGFMECVALNWIYTHERFAYDISLMLGHRPNLFWRVTWCCVTPLIIGTTILFNIIYYKSVSMDDYVYPGNANVVAWFITLFPFMIILCYLLFVYCQGGGLDLLRKLSKPITGWGPVHECDRKGTMYDPNYDPNESMDLETVDETAKEVPEKEKKTKKKPIGIATVTTHKDQNAAKDSELTPILKHKPANNNDTDNTPPKVDTRITMGVRFGEEDESNV